jgi:predicted DNA-binding protein (UPF0251 family)
VSLFVGSSPVAAPENGRAKHGPSGSPQKSSNLEHTEELPEKQVDLSRYLDDSNLTEIQREVMSLIDEYKLSVSKVARRMDKNRKTIDEHYAAAKRKVEWALTNQRARNRASKSEY